jgi:D-beta-D-heptose 7-phosphate kinase/D-beta-D-heptose 1-phosphate adenosyltransferase
VVKVWLNGSFDILHIGHIRLINHAASLGIVRVGLDTDERIREKKGMERPFNTLSDRIEFISSITGIDSVVSFGSNNELIFTPSYLFAACTNIVSPKYVPQCHPDGD